MSANLSTNEAVGDDLDLNSVAVQLDEQEEVTVVNVSESTVTISVSETESLTEFLNGQDHGSDLVVEKDWVCSGASDVNPADVRADVSVVHLVEENFDEEAVRVGVIEKGVKMESVDGGVDDKERERFDVTMSREVCVSKDGDRKTVVEVVEMVEESKSTMELSFKEALVDPGGSDEKMGVGTDALMLQKDGIIEVEDETTGEVEKKVECSVSATESLDEHNHVAQEGDGLGKDSESVDRQHDEKVGEENDVLMLQRDDAFEEEVRTSVVVKEVECPVIITESMDEGVIGGGEAAEHGDLEENGSIEGGTDETDTLEEENQITGEVDNDLECLVTITKSLDEQTQIVSQEEVAADTGLGEGNDSVNRESDERVGYGIGLVLQNDDMMEKEVRVSEVVKEVECFVLITDSMDEGVLGGGEAAEHADLEIDDGSIERGTDEKAGDGVDMLRLRKTDTLEEEDRITSEVEKDMECLVTITESLDEQAQIVGQEEVVLEAGLGEDNDSIYRESDERAGYGIDLMLQNDNIKEKEYRTSEVVKEVECSVVIMDSMNEGVLGGGEAAEHTDLEKDDGSIEIGTDEKARDGINGLRLQETDTLEEENQITDEVEKDVECSVMITKSLDEQAQFVGLEEVVIDADLGEDNDPVNRESDEKTCHGIDLMLQNDNITQKEYRTSEVVKEVECSVVITESRDEGVLVVGGKEVATDANLVRENAAVERGSDEKAGDGIDALMLQKDVLEEKDRVTAEVMKRVRCSVMIRKLSDGRAQIGGGAEVALAYAGLEGDVRYVDKGNDFGEDDGINVLMLQKDRKEEDPGEVLKKVEFSVRITEPLVESAEVVCGGGLAASTGLERILESVDRGTSINKPDDGFDVSMSEKVGILEDEDQKTRMEVVKELEGSIRTMESLIEQTQVVIEERVEEMDKEVSIPNDEVQRADTLGENPSCLEENPQMKVDIVGGQTEKNNVVVVDADPFVGVESLSDRTAFTGRNSSSPKESPFTENDKQVTIAQAEESLSSKVDEVHKVDLGSNEGIHDACVTVMSDSAAEAPDGSHAAVVYTCPHRKGDPDSSQVAETVDPLLDRNLDMEILVTDRCASAHEDLKKGTHVSEPVTSDGVEDKKNVLSCTMEETQITGGCVSEAGVSQISVYESNIGRLVVDLGTCNSMNGSWSSGGEVVKEDISPPDQRHCRGGEVRDIGFSISDFDENAALNVNQLGSNGTQEIEIEEQATDIEHSKSIEKKTIKRAPIKLGSFLKEYHPSYCLPKEKGEFSVSDLVWGKVRSHPWWPGQIFYPSDSSEQAIKYYKKDSFLVAYFGDHTFAWNEASLLKPFRTHFLQMEKQSNSESFHNAVNSSLDEVSRRVELGLSCSCMPDEAYAKIKFQIIKNTGIREESSRRDGVDQATSVTSFDPDKLVEYIKALAQFPSGGAHRLELVIAQAQVSAFFRSKGYFRLPEFQICIGLLKDNADVSHSDATPVSKDEEQVLSGIGKSKSRESLSHKRKYISEDGVYPSKKERSLTELMGVQVSSDGDDESCGKSAIKSVSSSSGKKRKAIDSFYDEPVVQNRKKRGSLPGTSHTMSPSLKQSFKVGDCIRRVASQLTGSPPILKNNGERFKTSAVKVDGSRVKSAGGGFDVLPYTPVGSRQRRMVIPTEYSSPGEMLSQLCLAARDPMKGYSFLTVIVSFFSDFRDSISLDQSGSGKQNESLEEVGGYKAGSKSKRLSVANAGSAETFDFEDMKDTYWTDRIIQSNPEEQPSCGNLNRNEGSLLETPMEKDMLTAEPETSLELSPVLDSDYQFFDGNLELAAAKSVCYVDDKFKEEFSPTALILNFTEIDSIPSETNLNRIFSRFGPLKESETEVLRKTNRARVVFKKRADAEVAFSSAGKFSIFGPALVSYSLRYLSPVPSKASSRAIKQGRQNATYV